MPVCSGWGLSQIPLHRCSAPVCTLLAHIHSCRCSSPWSPAIEACQRALTESLHPWAVFLTLSCNCHMAASKFHLSKSLSNYGHSLPCTPAYVRFRAIPFELCDDCHPRSVSYCLLSVRYRTVSPHYVLGTSLPCIRLHWALAIVITASTDTCIPFFLDGKEMQNTSKCVQTKKLKQTPVQISAPSCDHIVTFLLDLVFQLCHPQ